ncbi:MAG: hypothetical protein Q7K37_01440 [Dehalococcoidia bacterium]|nr:hypothetical protein [Dehalococcoidia bacterium]
MTDETPTVYRPPLDPTGEPERLMILPRRVEDGTLLLVRRDSGHAPGLLSTEPPHPDEGLTEAVTRILRSRLDVQLVGALRIAEARRPARMGQPRRGADGTGWLRAIAVDVSGEPHADPLLASVEPLSPAAADAALATDLERWVLADALALFAAPPAAE